MLVNLYVDHLMAQSPESAEQVWEATKDHAHLFEQAANRIGMSPAEYKEFRNQLLDGKAVYVKLPHHFDAMSGARGSSVYAVHNAVVHRTIMGWRVRLADGNLVYVPQLCGNISFVHHVAIAAKPKHRPHIASAKTHFVPAIAQVPKETPVEIAPVETPPAPVAEAPVAPVAPAVVAATGNRGFLFFIPAALGGIVAGLTHSSTPPPTVPPCTDGSNLLNACQSSR
jgi:hypothetical protein